MKRAVDECHSWESDLKNVGRKASQFKSFDSFSERTRNGLLHFLWSILIFLLWLKNLNFKANWLNLRKALILFKINWKFTNLYTAGFNQRYEVQQTNRRANQMLISFALWHIFIPVSCIQMYRLSSICSTMAMAHKYVAGHLEIVTT